MKNTIASTSDNPDSTTSREEKTMKKQSIIQAIVVFVVIAAALFVAMNQTLPPDALPASAPATEFSAERAIEHIKAIAQEPRFPGTPGHERARDYVMDELTEMGLSPELQKTTSRGLYGASNWFAGVENVLARIEGTEFQEAILLTAHLDSTAFSPAASDNGSGVAILLETARALQAGPPLRNSVMLLFDSPEEDYWQGAVAFMTEHRWADDVELVITLDHGGLSGPSYVAVTSPENGWFIREFARASRYAAASSAEVGDSGYFRAFRAAGYSGCYLDFTWNRLVDSPLDTIENLNPPSIQHQGYQTLSVTRHFGNLNLQDPKDPDAIFFSVLRLGLVRYPRTWAVPIMLVAALAFAAVMALGFRRKILSVSGMGLGALVLVVSLITAPLVVRGLWALISSTIPLYQSLLLDHAYNEPLLGTAFASITIALTATWYALIQKVRKVSLPDLTMGALLLLTLATVVTSIASPEVSFAFAWPLLFGILAAGYWLYSVTDDREAFSAIQIAGLLVAAVVGIVLIVPLIFRAFMGTGTNDSVTPMAITLVALLAFLVPLLHIITRPHKWWLPVAAGLLALGTLGAALLDDFNATQPQQSTAFYALNADTGQAFWGGGSPDAGRLDEWAAQFFPSDSEKQPIPGYPVEFPFFVNAAPALSLAAPQVELVEESASGGVRTLHLHFSSPSNAHLMEVWADPALEIVSLEVNGTSSAPLFGAEAPLFHPGKLFHYYNLPDEGIDAIVEVKTDAPVELVLTALSSGLPEIPGITIEPMPDHVVPFHWPLGQATVVFKSVTIDGGGE